VAAPAEHCVGIQIAVVVAARLPVDRQVATGPAALALVAMVSQHFSADPSPLRRVAAVALTTSLASPGVGGLVGRGATRAATTDGLSGEAGACEADGPGHNKAGAVAG
jgi:hypothetical protein